LLIFGQFSPPCGSFLLDSLPDMSIPSKMILDLRG
jgi:hypothetical protein